MNTIQTAFEEWTRQVQLPGNISQDQATDIVQIYGPTLEDADGDAWWVAIATYYESLGIIAQPTYVQLRNYANNNEAGANDLFQGLVSAINFLPETVPVNDAINFENTLQAGAAIDPNKARIEALKSGGTSVEDVQFDAALDVAINALDGLAVSIADEITNQTQ